MRTLVLVAAGWIGGLSIGACTVIEIGFEWCYSIENVLCELEDGSTAAITAPGGVLELTSCEQFCLPVHGVLLAVTEGLTPPGPTYNAADGIIRQNLINFCTNQGTLGNCVNAPEVCQAAVDALDFPEFIGTQELAQQFIECPLVGGDTDGETTDGTDSMTSTSGPATDSGGLTDSGGSSGGFGPGDFENGG